MRSHSPEGSGRATVSSGGRTLSRKKFHSRSVIQRERCGGWYRISQKTSQTKPTLPVHTNAERQP